MPKGRLQYTSWNTAGAYYMFDLYALEAPQPRGPTKGPFSVAIFPTFQENTHLASFR